MPADAFDEALRLNLHGSVLPSMVFGEGMAARGAGCIVNISSMAALRVLSGVMAYSAAKAAIENFTRWMAVELSRRYGDGLRVNAVAPGFFLAEQNRARAGESGREPHRARDAHHRTHADGPARKARGGGGRGPLARQRRGVVRDRRRDPRRRRIQAPSAASETPMLMSFRWFGPGDPVSLSRIRQIPGVDGVVSALHGIPAGEAWPRDELSRLGERIDDAGLRFAVVESVPVHDDIKLGRPSRDRLIERYCESVRAVGEVGVPVLCYNFMPVLDWTRTSTDMRLGDGSATLAYDPGELAALDPLRGPAALPAWSPPEPRKLPELLAAFRAMEKERLWDNLACFLEAVVPVAEESGVLMAMHPDDPPWSVFGLPRIITDGPALERLLGLVDRPANGVTFCSGSLGAHPDNDLPGIVRRLGSRIHFAHLPQRARDRRASIP